VLWLPREHEIGHLLRRDPAAQSDPNVPPPGNRNNSGRGRPTPTPATRLPPSALAGVHKQRKHINRQRMGPIDKRTP